MLRGAAAGGGRATTTGSSLDGGKPLADPCSRWQPDGLRGPSRVLDTARVRVDGRAGGGVPLDELVVYELHVGTFTPEGTFDAAAARLPELRELGVTAVELMPVATFPGERGWGYDGVYTFAPHRAYGGPARARALRRRGARGRARGDPRRRLQPRRARLRDSSARSARTSPTATTRSGATRSTTRGAAVREWAIQNAEHVGPRLPRRRAAPRRGARDLRRPSRSTCWPSWPSGVRAVRPGRARDLRDGARRPRARSRSGATTRSGPTSSTTRCTSCSRASATATTQPYGKVADLARALRGHGRRAARRLRAEPRPGRQPRVRRPPAAGRAPARRRVRRSSRRRSPLLFMGEEYGETAPVPVLHRPRRPGDRRGDARGPAQGVRAVRGVRAARTCPTRRRSRRSSARSSTRTPATPSCAPSTRELLALRRDAAAPRSRPTSTRSAASCACAAATVELVADFDEA